ncbi:putative gamma-glutamylcysteine synthetase [Tilletiaria anomala UBC 951]|uniref:Glutamate--cysteine ligase n=1 Tax=Tilletiaria anomala (strain ATCC 24038 / CBS 436.72 / UBC 951) TaxID=1037660 RepID=A0A066VLZ4_TILAU|nr:putative gamma-glutamylcysteine synthetase [Tilletiaria anomala UBC 951]KDN42501.1 putative gamma-glutamylcysteine synthetase [Tilletiaria anomala UBC 951]
MGLLSLGTPLNWRDAKPLAGHIRHHGILQFLNLWRAIKDRHGDKLLWGDEIEYIVVSLDDEGRNAKLSLRQAEILQVLSDSHREAAEGVGEGTALDIPTFHPEYGRFMLESTPGSPYGASPKELRQVEQNMRARRKIARKHLKPNELPITITSFPRLGTNDVPFTEPHYEPHGRASQSLFLPDEVINPHVRFPTLTANIRKRRGEKVAINMPIFHDINTPKPFIDPTIPWDRDIFPGDKEAKEGAAKADHIYMDAMGFGMGCCCLQVTFQACSVQEARTVYDQLIPVGPLMLALTAASPAYRGYLADVDCRWDVISSAVDDRTKEERGLAPLKDSRMVMPKSRYDSVDSYLSQDPANRSEYNDNPLPIDEDIKRLLMEQGEGIDELLANHLAHLFIRDPLVIFSEMVDLNDETSMDHFENIQSTNWQTMRFKPPPPGGQIGWRVEFRSMEVQVTDFENAAFSIFVVLLTRAILSFGLNFYIPISKVDENMKRAHIRDAVHTQKFYFRKEVFRQRRRHGNVNPAGGWGMRSRASSGAASPRSQSVGASGAASPKRGMFEFDGSAEANNVRLSVLVNGHNSAHATAGASGTGTGHRSGRSSRAPSPELGPVEDEYDEFTMDELINGKGEHFPGLLGLIYNYLDSLNIDVETRCEMNLYLDLVGARANGSLMTTATWIRKFVRSHPEYKGDSVVSAGINYDMIRLLDKIEQGEVEAPCFLPKFYAARRKAGSDDLV